MGIMKYLEVTRKTLHIKLRVKGVLFSQGENNRLNFKY